MGKTGVRSKEPGVRRKERFDFNLFILNSGFCLLGFKFTIHNPCALHPVPCAVSFLGSDCPILSPWSTTNKLWTGLDHETYIQPLGRCFIVDSNGIGHANGQGGRAAQGRQNLPQFGVKGQKHIHHPFRHLFWIQTAI